MSSPTAYKCNGCGKITVEQEDYDNWWKMERMKSVYSLWVKPEIIHLCTDCFGKVKASLGVEK